MSVSATNAIYKQPGETLKLAFEYSSLLLSGDSISSSVYVSGLKIGGGVSDVGIAAISVSGTQVIFSCSGGTAYNKYKIESAINTTLGEVLNADGFLYVNDF